MSAEESGNAIVVARTPDELAAVKELFVEYAQSLGFSLGYQGFEREMAEFPGRYAPPDGILLLARVRVDGHWHAAGGVGLRALGPGICEMKRMYVRPQFRALGLGRSLAAELFVRARERGYGRMRLDTVADQMQGAVGLYRALGFVEIPPYYDSPLPGTLYMERVLEASASGTA